MPIYEYSCTACNHEFEDIVGINDLPPICPLCAREVDRKISLASFRLKGGGWYADAYTGKSNKTPLPKSTEEKE